MGKIKYCILLWVYSFVISPVIAQSNPNNFYPHSKHSFRYTLLKMNHPEMFQGIGKQKNYFEGWYFKMVSANGLSILSIIPGISLSNNSKEQHAFIQIIDGITTENQYFTFPIDSFSFSKNGFEIRIGQNYFSQNKIVLNLKTDSSFISGEIQMNNLTRLPSGKIFNPGIMGWYRFVPFMECYHGVVSLNHNLTGVIINNGKNLNFNNGLGYIEKDWGSSMPAAWVWMQSNHFTNKNCSFMLSVANVPWLSNSFTGFLGFFMHNDTIHRFATYTNAKLILDEIMPNMVKFTVTDRNYVYKIHAMRHEAGMLKAPIKGAMDRRISESINAQISLLIYDKRGTLIFSDSTSIAGLELVGDMGKLRKP